MASLSTEIKITNELRPVQIADSHLRCFFKCENALFHQFTRDGKAIIELENGVVTTVEPNCIKFLDNKYSDYCFNESKEPLVYPPGTEL